MTLSHGGIDAQKAFESLIRLSYRAVDEAGMAREEKRRLLFSLYSFFCLFDEALLRTSSKTLLKYGCSFLSREPSLLDRPDTCRVTDKKTGRAFVKFDAGSPLYFERVAAGAITGEDAVYPEKLTLYSLAHRTATLENADIRLKCLWYVFFPYIPLIGAPFEAETFLALKAALCRPDVFCALSERALCLRLAGDAETLCESHPVAGEWYEAYLLWQSGAGHGDWLDILRRALRKKRFDFVKAAASGYLDRHPDDEKTALTLLAAIHGQGVGPPRAKDTEALETALALCDSFLSRGLAAPAPFRYAKGLCLLGLGGLSAAIDAFAECLEADPEYRPARAMLLRLKRTLTSA